MLRSSDKIIRNSYSWAIAIQPILSIVVRFYHNSNYGHSDVNTDKRVTDAAALSIGICVRLLHFYIVFLWHNPIFDVFSFLWLPFQMFSAICSIIFPTDACFLIRFSLKFSCLVYLLVVRGDTSRIYALDILWYFTKYVGRTRILPHIYMDLYSFYLQNINSENICI